VISACLVSTTRIGSCSRDETNYEAVQIGQKETAKYQCPAGAELPEFDQAGVASPGCLHRRDKGLDVHTANLAHPGTGVAESGPFPRCSSVIAQPQEGRTLDNNPP